MTIQIGDLFSEPSGWKVARISILASLAFFGIYAFFELLGDGGSVEVVVFGVAAGMSGIAEALPKDRWRPAAVLRSLALGILVVLVVNVLVS